MKNKQRIIEFVVAGILVVLLILFVDPFGLGMSNALYMGMTMVITIVFALFAGLIWREQASDEREVAHRMFADRIGYLSGACAIIFAIVIQSFRHAVDPWLVAVLVVMISARVLGFARARIRQ